MLELAPLHQRLIGNLIGLAKATDGNEHLITPSSTAVVVDVLRSVSQVSAEEDKVLKLLGRVEDAKYKMVPDCFTCACPCGRTNSYDVSCIDNSAENIKELKYRIIEQLCECTDRIDLKQLNKHDEELLYHGLIAVGTDDISVNILYTVSNGLQSIITNLSPH